MAERLGWVDASAGVAGDMLLGALLDAGVDPAVVRTAVDAVLPGAVEITYRQVTRAGLRATKADVRPLLDDPPHRTWRDIEGMLRSASLAEDVRVRALAVFGRLAEAEARVHGIAAADVHFHEVGALDSIADVVGVCAGLDSLGLDRLVVGRIALGSGTTRAAHGRLAVPVPAVLELSTGWQVSAGGEGELTTPTGMALLMTLADGNADLPAVTVERSGVGAGSRDTPGRANVTRLVIGTAQQVGGAADELLLLETNVDDLDPRLWPGVLAGLLAAGAADAWLTPILAKKGRPAHVLSVLVRPEQRDAALDLVLGRTSSLGVRIQPVARYAVPRLMVDVALAHGSIAVKVGHRNGVVLQVTPEFADVAAYARAHGRAEQEVMADALAAAVRLGYRAGAPLPEPDPPG
ncbi:nickel pincer cofactor biosynthesis protein LarC [Microlunatus ginsengisoli]|uniref:Pyridinium-3,5-bisthiocarboxylic acid mononucleotide nickel insertion protein n=1 Tax=Microlunatus ginsengisoli TaxID=363863 RepID=A0ABP6ZA64_9ACTN